MMLGTEVKEAKELREVKDRIERSGPIKKHEDCWFTSKRIVWPWLFSRFTKRLPRGEQFELGRQVRRCDRSIPANIVEGWTKRNSAAEFKRHLLIASGEAAETRFWIDSRSMKVCRAAMLLRIS
jgi:23S rRNA-intervening sequence protein